MEPTFAYIILKVCTNTNDCLIEKSTEDGKQYCIVHPERQDDKVWLNSYPDSLVSSSDWVDWNKPLEEMGGLSMNDIMVL